MADHLLPRLSPAAAQRRLGELRQLGPSSTATLGSLPLMTGTAPNPTGGTPATALELADWRARIMDELTTSPEVVSRTDLSYPMALGRLLSEVIAPMPADASHDEVWAFLSLNLLPDLVARRWPLTSSEIPQPALENRWIGRLVGGRDRSYLKTCWRRWQILSPVHDEMPTQLGEDELVGLLERTSLARNVRLIRRVAVLIAGTEMRPRSDFNRVFLKLLTYRTGPLMLDVLSDAELDALLAEVDQQAKGVFEGARISQVPRRALRTE